MLPKNLNEHLEFIKTHKNADVQNLALDKNHPSHLDLKFCLNQIKAKQKLKTKLPVFFENDKLIIPNFLATEQASSELTSRLKSTLYPSSHFFDATGGLGADLLAFRRISNEMVRNRSTDDSQTLVHCDLQESVHEAAKHNMHHLGFENVKCILGDGIQAALDFDGPTETLYLDPSRRSEAGRVYGFEEMEPRFLDHLPVLTKKFKRILVKAAPMIQLERAVKQLEGFLKEVLFVSLADECKEVVFVLESSKSGPVNFKHAHHSSGSWDFFDVEGGVGFQESARFEEDAAFLHLPWPSVMKSQAYRLLTQRFHLSKLSANSHIYFSDELVAGFPGSTFKVEEKLNPKKGLKASGQIILRNSKLSLSDWQKKLKLKPGSGFTLVASSNKDQKAVLYKVRKV